MTTQNFTRFLVPMLLFVSLLLPEAAMAQDREREAQVYFEKGAAYYFEGEYGQALVQFKKGHATLPNALFQYNIALCNLKLERYREALNAARDAERMGGLGPNEQTLNRSRIAAIPRIQTATTVAEAVARSADTSSDVADADVSQGTESGGGGFGGVGWAGVAFTTVGVGLLVGAVGVEVALQSKWEEFNESAESGDTARFEELKGEIERRQRTGKILLYSGLGASAIGVTLLIAEWVSYPSSDDKQVSVFVTPQGDFGVGAAFRF